MGGGYAWCGCGGRLVLGAAKKLPHCEPHHHAQRCCEGNGYQESDETEQVSKGEQSEHQPDWIELDALPDDAWRQHIISEVFADEKNAANNDEGDPIRPELGNCNAHG